jgi:hypothetical protein
MILIAIHKINKMILFIFIYIFIYFLFYYFYFFNKKAHTAFFFISRKIMRHTYNDTLRLSQLNHVFLIMKIITNNEVLRLCIIT